MFEDRRRGHRHVGGALGRGERERHWVIAAIAVAVVAAAASGYAAYSAAEAQSQAADYNKKVAKNQAIASRNAASVAAQNRQEELRRIFASQRARLGASGVEPSEGSPLLVQMESARQGELDLARIHYAGETRAVGYQSEAILQGFYARSAQRAGQVGAGASLLGGVSGAAGGYASYNRRQPATDNSGGY